MKILVVDDDPTFLDEFVRSLKSLVDAEVVIAISRDGGLRYLNEEIFDLIVCDLKLPTVDGGLDLETAHGDAVVGHARKVLPGTPIIILSAFGTVEHVSDYYRDAPKLDLVGDGLEMPLVDYRTKAQLQKCLDSISHLATRLKTTESIELRGGISGISLSDMERRALKIFARRIEGRFISVSEITGGLSESRVLRLRVADGSDSPRSFAVAKVGPLETVKDEVDRFERFVVPILGVGTITALQYAVLGGAGSLGAIFYQLSAETPSLFDQVIVKGDEFGERAVRELAGKLKRWWDRQPVERVPVGSLRALAIETAEVEARSEMFAGLDWRSLEEREVHVRKATQHGDLHGENILVTDSGDPIIIDYGQVGRASSSLDPIILELSLLFHPKGRKISGNWPSQEQTERWNEIEVFLKACPVPRLVRACRAWALEASPSDITVMADAYAFAVRQFRFDDTDKDLARALIRCSERNIPRS